MRCFSVVPRRPATRFCTKSHVRLSAQRLQSAALMQTSILSPVFACFPQYLLMFHMPTRLMTAHAAAGRWSRTARHIRIVRHAWSADGNCKCTALCYIIRFKQPNKFAFVLSSSQGRWFFDRNNCEYLYHSDRFMHRRDAAARDPAAIPRLFI